MRELTDKEIEAVAGGENITIPDKVPVVIKFAQNIDWVSTQAVTRIWIPIRSMVACNEGASINARRLAFGRLVGGRVRASSRHRSFDFFRRP